MMYGFEEKFNLKGNKIAFNFTEKCPQNKENFVKIIYYK